MFDGRLVRVRDVTASYDKRRPLWNSCVMEVRWTKGLLPTFALYMRRSWSRTVTACDASLFGYGVVESEWAEADITQTSRPSERARFLGPLAEAMAPRSAAQEAEVLIVGRACGFAEVRREAIEGARWRTVLSRRWRRREAIQPCRAPARARGVKPRTTSRAFGGQPLARLRLGEGARRELPLARVLQSEQLATCARIAARFHRS